MDAVLIRNPIAGDPALQQALSRALSVFHAAGWQVDVWTTERKGHSRELAVRAVEQGYPRVIIAGGDGSIEQTVDGIIMTGATEVRLGIIPLGTGNVLARDLGLPFPTRYHQDATVAAARIILEEDPILIDVGLANGTAFLCWAGTGLDAMATARVESNLEFKRRAPIPVYAAEALRAVHAYTPSQMRIICDDEVIEGEFPIAAVCNISLYARFFRVLPDAKVDDGYLDLLVFRSGGYLPLITLALKILSRPGASDDRLVHRRCQKVTIEAEPPLPYHLDGDPAGDIPIDIEVLPRRLPVYLDRERAAPRLVHI